MLYKKLDLRTPLIVLKENLMTFWLEARQFMMSQISRVKPVQNFSSLSKTCTENGYKKAFVRKKTSTPNNHSVANIPHRHLRSLHVSSFALHPTSQQPSTINQRRSRRLVLSLLEIGSSLRNSVALNTTMEQSLMETQQKHCSICRFPGADVCFLGCSCLVHAVRPSLVREFWKQNSRLYYQNLCTFCLRRE